VAWDGMGWDGMGSTELWSAAMRLSASFVAWLKMACGRRVDWEVGCVLIQRPGGCDVCAACTRPPACPASACRGRARPPAPTHLPPPANTHLYPPTCLLSFWMSRLRLITCSRFSSYARSWPSMRSKSLQGTVGGRGVAGMKGEGKGRAGGWSLGCHIAVYALKLAAGHGKGQSEQLVIRLLNDEGGQFVS